MPREYKRVVTVTYCHTNDGNNFLVSVRYGAVTINGIRFVKRTRQDRQQIMWPKYRLWVEGRDKPYPAINPARGFTQHVISAIERFLSEQQRHKTVVPRVPGVGDKPDGQRPSLIPKQQPARPAHPKPTTDIWPHCPVCRRPCGRDLTVKPHDFLWLCPSCGKHYENKDDRLVWSEENSEAIEDLRVYKR
jgi:hypothetical protein